MTPERHQQIKRLFLAAVELAPQQAASFLDSACGADDALRTEVQSLLAHHAEETLLPTHGLAGTTSTLPESLDMSATDQTPGSEAALPIAVRPPGTIVAGRYRLVAPLGRGGMGVVYRAEDLELNQTIALKFLSPPLKDFDGAVEMLRREARLARQITHPNVVRVFDIGIADGEVFISMEFVAGENLESLVRRVGRLTADKLLQIARQMAAGIAAAHDAGILHRDLKPANVMIDASGDVRILDFGIAAALDDRKLLRALAGTPGFVAPELLQGHTPSSQSDLYAWGLVVYYAATGMLPPFEPHSQGSTAQDPLLANGVDAELAAVVQACLQSKASLRPKSAYDLVVALSAGDPLRATIESGRMPLPDLVVAARSWQPSVRLLNGLAASGLLLLALISLLADRTLFLSRCGLAKSPDALQEIAQNTLLQLGWTAPQRPVLTGVKLDANCVQFIAQHAELPDPWGKIRTGQFPALVFWYRQGDPRLPRPTPLGEPDRDRLAHPIPGTASVQLDGQGRLLSLEVGVAAPAADKGPSENVNWQSLFEAAGLQMQDFREVPATRWPPLFADRVQAWKGPHPAEPKLPLEITAAALQGRIVFFMVDQPWETARAVDAMAALSDPTSRFVTIRTALWLVLFALAAELAARNVRRGHADWLGAGRVAAAVMFLAALDWLLGARHTLVAAEELTVGYLSLNVIVFWGAAAGVAFVAVEPTARRWWPWSIITIRRLLAGRLTDSSVWADVLLGLVVGLATVLVRQLSVLVSGLVDVSISGVNDFDLGQDLLDCFGLRYKASVFIAALLRAVIVALLLLSSVLALKRLMKSTLVAAAVLVVVLASLAVVGRGTTSPADWLLRALLWTIASWLLVRRGLLPTIAAVTTFYAINNTPLTLNFAAWYAPTSLFVQGTVLIGLIVFWRLARPKHRAGHDARFLVPEHQRRLSPSRSDAL